MVEENEGGLIKAKLYEATEDMVGRWKSADHIGVMNHKPQPSVAQEKSIDWDTENNDYGRETIMYGR